VGSEKVTVGRTCEVGDKIQLPQCSSDSKDENAAISIKLFIKMSYYEFEDLVQGFTCIN
jgi:hypothetical protein